MGTIRISERIRTRDYDRSCIERKLLGKIGVNLNRNFTFEEIKETNNRLNEARNTLEYDFISLFDYQEWDMRGVLFKRNMPIANCYFSDFYDDKNKVSIECDGPYHNRKEVIKKDKRKDQILSCLGIKTIRLSYRNINEWPVIISLFYQNHVYKIENENIKFNARDRKLAKKIKRKIHKQNIEDKKNKNKREVFALENRPFKRKIYLRKADD